MTFLSSGGAGGQIASVEKSSIPPERLYAVLCCRYIFAVRFRSLNRVPVRTTFNRRCRTRVPCIADVTRLNVSRFRVAIDGIERCEKAL